MLHDNDSLLSDQAFSRLALGIFRYQVDANPVYGLFVRSRGIDPMMLDDWRDIPAVPTRGFKEVPLLSQDPRPVEATFRTSGSTRGPAVRGIHQVRDLSLYRESLLSTADRYLRPELWAGGLRLDNIRNRIRILILTPPPMQHSESSLIYMFTTLMDEWGDGRSRFLADPEWGVPISRFGKAIAAAHQDGVPVFLAGTAFGFVHLLDALGDHDCPPLPSGSVVLETGGFKGRSRTVSRIELYQGIGDSLALPRERILNEYGMTELLSQFYEPILLENGPARLEERRHLGPPWTRTRVLDPDSLQPVSSGKPGILCHMDLANLDSVAAVLTDDIGVAVDDGFRVLGRSEEAEPRGCSLMVEDLINASAPTTRARPPGVPG